MTRLIRILKIAPLALLALVGLAVAAPNFVDDNTALPGLKTDRVAPTNPSQQWTASDANTVINALRDLRTVAQRDWLNVKAFGALGDGVTNDTAAIQAAINATQGRTLYFPKGKYLVTVSLVIATRSHHFVGDFANRFADGGTEISYTGVGPLFQIGTDSGNLWDSNEYDGPQDQVFENLWLSHGAPDTTLVSANVGGAFVYKAGAYGIWDWRGGQIVLRNMAMEKFEANFVGIQSDIDTIDFVISLYSKYGLYFGPRSDQASIHHLYSFSCDRAVTIDRAGSPRIEDAQIVGSGTSTVSPIEVRRGSYGVRIIRPWLEHLQGYQGVDQQSFVSAGEVNGYGGAGGSISTPGAAPTTTPVAGLTIEDPMTISFLPAVAAHTKYIATVGKCQQFVLSRPSEQINSALSNFDALVAVQAAQAPSNTETQIWISGVPSSLSTAQLYVNLGGGVPTIDLDKFGTAGRVFGSSVTLGATTAAGHVINGAVTTTLPANTNNGGFFVQNTTSNTTNSILIRGVHTGTVDTTLGFRQAIAVGAVSNATRSTGGSSLQNVGLQASATGAQDNQAIQTISGDVQLNTTSGTTVLNKSWRSSSELVPTAISANQNDYNPAGLSDAAVVIVSATAPFNVTGFAGGAAGRWLVVYNNGANAITLTNQDAASSAANRVIGRAAANTVLAANTGLTLYYSPSISRWLVVGDTL